MLKLMGKKLFTILCSKSYSVSVHWQWYLLLDCFSPGSHQYSKVKYLKVSEYDQEKYLDGEERDSCFILIDLQM